MPFDVLQEIKDECSSFRINNSLTTMEGLDQGHLDIKAPESYVLYGGCRSSNSGSDYTYGTNAYFILFLILIGFSLIEMAYPHAIVVGIKISGVLGIS